MKHNKHERRGEDHGTRDTKNTATDIAQEKYPHLNPETALFMATMDLQDEYASKQELRHKMERDDKFVEKSEIENGINDYFAPMEQEVGTEIAVDSVETAPVNIEVYRIPAQKLGEVALADK